LISVNDSDDFLDKIAENEDEDEDAFLQVESYNEAQVQKMLVHYDFTVRDTVRFLFSTNQIV
jgi:hypothetical protein